jgi:predicted ABC-type ATPase
MPRCLIIAGPNGAGKTTFALKYLPKAGIEHFINADLIASGLSPFHPEKQAAAAGRLFLSEVDARIHAQADFAFETTLAGRGYLKLIERLHKDGWTIELFYLALPSVELSKARVAERFSHGGHNIPSADIERRFPRSLRNLMIDYRMRVDKCVCYMNDRGLAVKIFEQAREFCRIDNQVLFEYIQALAG